MTNHERDELHQVLKDLCEECPEYRFGQLIANLAVVARGAEPSAVWDMEDEELLAAIRWQLDQRHAEPQTATLVSTN